jgi:hypothetical protein
VIRARPLLALLPAALAVAALQSQPAARDPRRARAEPGRSDTYEPQLEGRHIAITPRSAPTGIYLLTQTLDPMPAVRALRACPDTPTCS